MATAIDPGKLRPGMTVVINKELYLVQSFDLRTPGNLRSFVRSKMKNLRDGRVVEMTFRGSAEEILEADYETKTCQFLYKDQGHFIFMDLQTYEQFTLDEEFLGLQSNFLIPEAEVLVAFWEARPVSVELPPKMVFTVTDTVSEVSRGNSSGSIMKDAKIETGFVVQVPSFIKNGEKIRISTEDGAYVDRGSG